MVRRIRPAQTPRELAKTIGLPQSGIVSRAGFQPRKGGDMACPEEELNPQVATATQCQAKAERATVFMAEYSRQDTARPVAGAGYLFERFFLTMSYLS
jgi:hypothetical protein